jgi:transcriptional regulator of met regulon
MKCIKVIKETKDNKIGTIRRVTNSEADTKVSSGVWTFAPKSEWKALRKPTKSDQATDQATDQVVELSIEEKKLARKKKNK